MPHKPEDSSEQSWHRYFAMECNNRAWALAIVDRSAEEDLEMLNAAQASLYHWTAIGTRLNQIRAKMLVAEVHSLLGIGDSASLLAREVSEYFSTHAGPDWELAFVATIDAHAASVSGDSERHAASHKRAQALLDSIADPEDRLIVQATFERVPAP